MSVIKAKIAMVNLGGIQSEGLIGDDNRLYMAAPQVASVLGIAGKNASRQIKARLGKDVEFIKISTPLNSRCVNAIPLPSLEKALFSSGIKKLSNAKSAISDRNQFVYVIGDLERGVVKIGISSNPEKRLAGIQVSYPYPLSILVSVPVPDAKKVERLLHDKLADCRLCGEWFDGIALSLVDWSQKGLAV